MRTPEQIKQDNLTKTRILLRELRDAMECWADNSMKIEATTYTREDGVCLIKSMNHWWLRSICGPAWFWNPSTAEWEIEHNHDLYDRFNLTKEQGMKLLETIEKKS